MTHDSWLHKKEDILIESETKKLFLQEALFTTTMSKARVPKRKEEYVPPDEINEFREEILEAGRHLAVVNRPRFPDAEKVSEAIGKVLDVVDDYKLLGRWVTSRVSNSTTKYATTKTIREVCFLYQSMQCAISNYPAFLQITLQAVIDCVVKSNTCFEADPLYWMEVKIVGFKLLSHLDLKRYRSKFPDEKDLQDEWEDAVTNRGKYVNLLVGQQTEEDQRRETDEENYYDDSSWEQKTKNFFLAYYQVKAQTRYFASRPDEAEHYKKFQVRTCV